MTNGLKVVNVDKARCLPPQGRSRPKMLSCAVSQRRPLLSVVLASIEAERNLARALEAIAVACRDIVVEVIVVDASTDASSQIARESHVPTLVVEREPGTIAPYLWSDGIRRSRGTWVALTTGHCVVPPDWARSLVAALETDAGAAGSGLLPLEECGLTDLAVFFLRYHAFVPLVIGDVRPAPELPGDNAAYAGDDVRAAVTGASDGFFEVEHHRLLRRGGRTLLAVPRATARFGRSFPLRTILEHRFLHGRQFGAWRSRVDGASTVTLLVKAPLVPGVLFARALRSVSESSSLRLALLRCSIHFLLLASAWAVGEALGALQGASSHE